MQPNQQNQKKPFMSRRVQMAIVGLGLWLALALWSIAAFWQHIDELQPTYPTITKIGAVASEFAVLALVLWHCFNAHINVRKWSLIFSIILSAAILIHAGALRGMNEARNAQLGAEKRLEEKLTKMSKEQMGAANGRFKSRTQQEIATNAQKEVAETIKTGEDRVKNSSILPRWYLDGWMYAVLFILSLIFVGIPMMMMTNEEDIDSNYDGIPDHLQGSRYAQQGYPPPGAYPYAYPPGYYNQPPPQPQPKQAEWPEEIDTGKDQPPRGRG